MAGDSREGRGWPGRSAAPPVSALTLSPSSIFSAVSPFVCARARLAHANKALPTAVVEALPLK